MEIRCMRTFLMVADLGSFSKAADVLGLTPSAISHAISSMENELGFTVLTRNKSGVTLTGYGEHLLPYINAVLNCDESLQQVVAEFKGLKRGKVRVGTFASVCSNWIPQIITSFREKYPAITIELYQGTYDDVSYWIKNGIVDFGFLSTSSAGDLPISPFYLDPLLCVVPHGFRKEDSSGSMTVHEMAKHQFVVQAKSTDADVQIYMKENHLEVNSSYHVSDDLSMITMVENGLGICIIPALTAEKIMDKSKVDVYPVEPAASRMIGLSALNPKSMAPAVRTLYNHIIETYQNTAQDA